MKLAIGISTLAFVVATVALGMVLWPIVSEAPWEENNWSTLIAPDPKEVTSPPLPNPGGQPTLGGEISTLKRCLSAYRRHTHTYAPPAVSHSHVLQQDYFSDRYSISPYQQSPWGLGEATSGPENIGLAFAGC